MTSPTETPTVFVPCGLVTLTTDFGTVDGYVGAMKGRILSCASAELTPSKFLLRCLLYA